MKRLLLSIACLFMLTGSIWAQERAISGKISDESGEALPGVTILVKGTTTGTQSNFEGDFKLNVPADGTHLIFSFVGMSTQEVEIGNQTEFSISMAEDTQQLSEIVVTAQGIVKTRNELTYAAQQIGGDAVSKTRNTNFVNNLSGKVAGVNVKSTNTMGGSTNIVIRGATSLGRTNQALFIVDGVPIDNTSGKSQDPVGGGVGQESGGAGYDFGSSAADINPDDIESINILKGAAATVLYGSRAANGVVLITTKKGKANNGIGVTLNIGGGFDKIDESTFPTYQNEYGAGYGGSFISRDVDGDGNQDDVVSFEDDASYGDIFDGHPVYFWDAYDPTSPNYGKSRPWVVAENGPVTFFETGKRSNISVSVDGQTDKGYFKFGYTKTNQTGILPNSSLNKDYVNFGASYKLAPKLTMSSSINFTTQGALGRYGSGYDDNNMMQGFRQWWQVNTDIKKQKEAYERTGQNVTWNRKSPEDADPRFTDNPYFNRYENYESDSRLRYFGYASMNYEAADWVSLSGRVSVDSYTEEQQERTAVGSHAVSQYSTYKRTFSEYNYNFSANFKKDINEDLSFTGLIGTNTMLQSDDALFQRTNGGLVLPEVYSLSNTTSALLNPTETYFQNKIIGIFASASFAYKKMLFVEAAFRRDYSSSLPKDNNAFNYPAISAAFSFTDLIGTNDIFTAGKFRASYAEIGNGAPAQKLTDVYTNTNLYGGSPKYSVFGIKNNPDLKEERTKDLELGLEVSFLDGRVGFDLAYYQRVSEDQIVDVTVSRATGYGAKVLNAGTIENNGVEIVLFAKPIKTDDFSWNVGVNFSRNRNEVTALPDGIDNILLNNFQSGVTINAALGEPYGTIRGTDFVYDDNGNKIKRSLGRYQKSNANQVIGNANPDWLAGISNDLRYKNLALSFLIDIRKGGDIYSLDMYYGNGSGLYPETVGLNDLGNPLRNSIADGGGVLLPGVNPDGSVNEERFDGNIFGASAYGYSGFPHKNFVYDAGYVKLREVAITYSLPSSIMEKIKIAKSIDISIVGRNLWIISSSLPYADPEANFGAGNVASGYSGNVYPTARNIGFNLKLKF